MSFSPGLQADHPAFGFAMWDNTPASGMAQGGHYPSGPSAMPVGTPARSLLDYVQGRNRVDNLGGSDGARGATPQRNDGASGGQNHQGNSASSGYSQRTQDPLAELENWVRSNGLNAQTMDALKSAGCDNLNGLQYLQCGDLERFGLPIVQLRMLQKALGFSAASAPPPPGPVRGAEANSSAPPNLSGLGIGVHPPGAVDNSSSARPGYTMQLDRPRGKVDYHDIVDFLPCSVGVEEEEIAGGDGQTKILLRRGPKRVALERVTANQWNCANMVIMDKLHRDGMLGPRGLREYMNYTFVINELAGRYQWQSVLGYDREYRQLQATEKFPWGSQVDHLSRVFLKEKVPEPTYPKGAPGKNQHTKSSPKESGGSAEGGICGLYNAEGRDCFYKKCKYAHVCSLCGKGHPKYRHGMSAASKVPDQGKE